MSADMNVTEKVARAIEDALMQPTHAPMATHDPRTGNCQACPWPVHELPVPDMADALAPAALATLADPEVLAGIAEVQREHFWAADDDKTCECGWTASSWRAYLDSEGHGALEEAAWDFTDHQAAAVVEWLGAGR